MRAPAALALLTLLATAPARAGGEEPVVCTLKNQEFCGFWWGSAAFGDVTIQDGGWRDPKRDSTRRCTVLEEFRREGRPFSVFECVYSSPRVTNPAEFVLLSLIVRYGVPRMVFTSARSRACLDISIQEMLTDRRILANCITGQHYFRRPD